MARGMELVEGRKMDVQAHTKYQGVGTPRPRLNGIPPHAGTQRPRVLWSVSSQETLRLAFLRKAKRKLSRFY